MLKQVMVVVGLVFTVAVTAEAKEYGCVSSAHAYEPGPKISSSWNMSFQQVVADPVALGTNNFFSYVEYSHKETPGIMQLFSVAVVDGNMNLTSSVYNQVTHGMETKETTVELSSGWLTQPSSSGDAWLSPMGASFHYWPAVDSWKVLALEAFVNAPESEKAKLTAVITYLDGLDKVS